MREEGRTGPGGEETTAPLEARGLIPPHAVWTHQAGKGPPDFLSLLQFSRRAGSDFETLEPGLPTQTLLSFARAWNPVARGWGGWGWGVGAGQKGGSVFHRRLQHRLILVSFSKTERLPSVPLGDFCDI